MARSLILIEMRRRRWNKLVDSYLVVSFPRRFDQCGETWGTEFRAVLFPSLLHLYHPYQLMLPSPFVSSETCVEHTHLPPPSNQVATPIMAGVRHRSAYPSPPSHRTWRSGEDHSRHHPTESTMVDRHSCRCIAAEQSEW